MNPASAERSTTRLLSGWGQFPREECHLYRPEKRSAIRDILESEQETSYISRGLGRSYGDAALNRDAGLISSERLNRFLGFDPESGVVHLESGVSLAEIITHFLPRGFFFPVTPGTKFVSLGGAIASDVHGKNHHRDGTLGRFVRELTLLTASGERMRCSSTENADVFWATVGGMGLTGVILDAKIQLRRVESAYVQTDYRRARDLDHALELFAQTDADQQYSVAWIDCLAQGGSLGRSVLILGDHATRAQAGHGDAPLALPRTLRKPVPFHLPSGTLNRYSIGLFNALYYRAHPDRAGQLVDLDAFFYPLDAIPGWNRLYGHRGLAQYQVAFPEEGGRTALVALLERISGSRRASFLAVLKKFGDANPGLLSFPFRGYTLALDLPVTADLPDFLRGLDALVLDHGGRIYLAKDAVTTPAAFARMYPRLEEFRQIKQRLDPAGLFSSSLARRVGIVE